MLTIFAPFSTVKKSPGGPLVASENRWSTFFGNETPKMCVRSTFGIKHCMLKASIKGLQLDRLNWGKRTINCNNCIASNENKCPLRWNCTLYYSKIGCASNNQQCSGCEIDFEYLCALSETCNGSEFTWYCPQSVMIYQWLWQWLLLLVNRSWEKMVVRHIYRNKCFSFLSSYIEITMQMLSFSQCSLGKRK